MNPIYSQTPKINPLWSDARKLPPHTIVNEPVISTRRVARIVKADLNRLENTLANAIDEDYHPFPARIAKISTASTSPQPVIVEEQIAIPVDTAYEQLEIPVNSVPPYADVMPQFNRTVDKGGRLANFIDGAKKGFNHFLGDKGLYSKSVVNERMPIDGLTNAGKIGTIPGAIAADITGDGTRKFFWNMHPEDFLKTFGRKYLEMNGASRAAVIAGPWAAGIGLGVGSGNYNPLNLAEGGRTAGYSAVQADPDDPTKSTTPVSEILIDRGMFGRKGRLLPWEQFKQERPEVSYEQYEDYKNYLFNKDDNLLRSLSLGLAKGTFDGINGPELNVMGYGVTPLGAAAALGTLAAVNEGVKKYASLRR